MSMDQLNGIRQLIRLGGLFFLPMFLLYLSFYSFLMSLSHPFVLLYVFCFIPHVLLIIGLDCVPSCLIYLVLDTKLSFNTAEMFAFFVC